jgi:hypothetical protein
MIARLSDLAPDRGLADLVLGLGDHATVTHCAKFSQKPQPVAVWPRLAIDHSPGVVGGWSAI